jgi:hypothetical protein
LQLVTAADVHDVFKQQCHTTEAIKKSRCGGCCMLSMELELAMHNGHVSTANSITSQRRDPTTNLFSTKKVLLNFIY